MHWEDIFGETSHQPLRSVSTFRGATSPRASLHSFFQLSATWWGFHRKRNEKHYALQQSNMAREIYGNLRTKWRFLAGKLINMFFWFCCLDYQNNNLKFHERIEAITVLVFSSQYFSIYLGDTILYLYVQFFKNKMIQVLKNKIFW